MPLVEMAFETPVESGSDEHITGTINPGLLWDGGHGYQLGLEAMFPINHDSGSGPGFMANVHFYFDDLLPNAALQGEGPLHVRGWRLLRRDSEELARRAQALRARP